MSETEFTKFPSGAQFAVKSLAAFDHVNVPAGLAKDATIHVPLRQFEYWSTVHNDWKLPDGRTTNLSRRRFLDSHGFGAFSRKSARILSLASQSVSPGR